MATFHLDLVAPDRLTFQGEVDQVDVPGFHGDFGILAGHAPMVSLLRPGVLTVTVGNTQTKYVLLGGFAEVSPQGTLTVLADTASPIAEFDHALLHARITELEAKVKSMPQSSELDREILKLDQFKQVNTHLQGTAMH